MLYIKMKNKQKTYSLHVIPHENLLPKIYYYPNIHIQKNK